jgi:hypothetical protein
MSIEEYATSSGSHRENCSLGKARGFSWISTSTTDEERARVKISGYDVFQAHNIVEFPEFRRDKHQYPFASVPPK